VAGDSSRDIAVKSVLSVRTVDNHLQNVYSKLGVTSRDELAEVLRSSSGGPDEGKAPARGHR
jgi:DNA-binding NarL/FixJ family response regulator